MVLPPCAPHSILPDSLSRSYAVSIPVTSIIPTVRAASLLCDPVTTPQRNGAGSGSTHCSVLSRSRDAPGKALPDFHSMLSWIFSHGPVPGNQEQHFACATGTSGEPSRTEKKPAQKCARSIRHVLSLQPEYSCAQRSKWNHLRVTKTKLQHIASIQTKPPQTASRHENCTRTEDASGVEWSQSEQSKGDNLIFSLMFSRLSYRRKPSQRQSNLQNTRVHGLQVE